MKSTRHARGFRDLLVYHKANEVAVRIFEISKNFPKEEVYSLTDQIRRASRSSGAQIAEAWGKRRYEKHFVSKLTDADAEQMETQHWLDMATSCGYLSIEEKEVLETQLKEIGRMLNTMMAKSHLFCRQDFFIIKENANAFLIDDN
ncbi:MAG: four helix bundle protein [Syntrophales bacterium]|nr:four helix bundle protein [Syntrophales bacterium]